MSVQLICKPVYSQHKWQMLYKAGNILDLDFIFNHNSLKWLWYDVSKLAIPLGQLVFHLIWLMAVILKDERGVLIALVVFKFVLSITKIYQCFVYDCTANCTRRFLLVCFHSDNMANSPKKNQKKNRRHLLKNMHTHYIYNVYSNRK